MTRLCVEPGCQGHQHARSRCFDCWSALVVAEARAISKPRRRAQFEARDRTLFLEARKARKAGDTARRAFILRERRLPEDLPAKRRAAGSLKGFSVDRTFVSDIELDNGTGDWHGYDYFGDTQFSNWPEREKLGVGGRDLSRRKKLRRA